MWRRPGSYIIALLFSCENRGKRSWVSLTVSAICDLSASRRSLRTHQVAGGGQRHERCPVWPCPRHRWWRNKLWRTSLSSRPHNIGTLAARACAESVNTSHSAYALHVDLLSVRRGSGRTLGQQHPRQKSGLAIKLCRAQSPAHHTTRSCPHGVYKLTKTAWPG